MAVTIYERSIERYVADFFPGKKKAHGSLFISLLGARHVTILPLIRLSARSPQISIESFYGPDAVLELVTSLLDIHVNEKWAKYALSSVSSVSVIMDIPSRLAIEVKETARESWMPWPNRVHTREDAYFAALNWRKAVGLVKTLAMPQIYVNVAQGDENGCATAPKLEAAGFEKELSRGEAMNLGDGVEMTWKPVRSRWD